MVQAQVLYGSWPLDKSELTFANMLKDKEKKEMRGQFPVFSSPQDSHESESQ